MEMFKNILGFWSGKTFLEKVLEDFSQMIGTAEEMYNIVIKDYFDPNPDEAFKQSIYDMDRKINAGDRSIRKRIIEHLAVQPTIEINVSLILMSVVKDAERIGDHIKNLYEASRLLNRPLKREEFTDYFDEIPERISRHFMDAVSSFRSSDESMAYEVIYSERSLAKECEQILIRMAKSELHANRAVCFAMTARALKRIASHLANIATAVVVPVPDLDYFDERRRPTRLKEDKSQDVDKKK
jgi:phosphate uptake regulator